MEEIEEYRHDLWNEVLELARDRDIYDQEAFLRPRANPAGQRGDHRLSSCLLPLSYGHKQSASH